MNTLFASSPDGTQVAYDRCGTGPAIILLHGGGGNRQEWHKAGYVSRLRDNFTVITLDLRGHGQSGQPTNPASYTIDKMGQDILAVTSACRVEQFIIWAMSYGGKIGRYMAVQSEKVAKLILMGTPLGLGVSGELRQDAVDFVAHWPPIIHAQKNGTLDLNSLSQDDQDFLRQFNVPVMLAWVTAMLEWPAIEPADFRCPTLWLVGSEDRHGMNSYRKYAELLPDSKVQAHIVAGLDHEQLFSEIDDVFPILLAFTKR